MNLYRANSICRWYMSEYVKDKEEKYNKYFPDSAFRFPAPTFFLKSLEQCVELIERVSTRLTCAVTNLSGEAYFAVLMEIAEKNALRDGMPEDWEQKYVTGAAKCRFVVASACRYGDLVTAVGARHFSPAMHKQLDAIREEKLIDLDNAGKAEQGFIDQFDVFMTRAEAWDVAIASGQLNLRRYTGHCRGELFSEDVW